MNRQTGEIRRTEPTRPKRDDTNLTVYINIVDEKNVSPEQQEAIRQVREIYGEWIREAQ